MYSHHQDGRKSSLRISSPDCVPLPLPTRLLDQDVTSDYGFVLTDTGVHSITRHHDTNIDFLQPPPRKSLQGLHHPRFESIDDANTGRVLGSLSVVAITFFVGCGGPLGSEPLISTGGPLVALIAIIVYPLVFTFPYGSVVAELCTAFPEDGGFPVAVRNAFGQFWGVQVGYWSWVGSIMSTAIYPSILLDLLETHASLELDSPVVRYIVKAAIALVMSVPSLLGTKFVARTMIVFLVVLLGCTGMYVIWAFAASDSYDELGMVKTTNQTYNEATGRVQESGDINVDWFQLLNTLFWNYDGVQMASVFGGQVLIPARVYPRAISTIIALTVLVYLLPLPGTIGNDFINWTTFVAGSYGDVAETIGGDFLHYLMVVVNFVTTIGMFVSSTFCASTEIAGMAQSGMLHIFLGRRNQRCSSPHNAVGLTYLLILLLVALDTDFLIPITNTFACFVAAIIFAAGIQLRRKFPHFPRPSTVPGGPGVMFTIAVIPLVICATIVGKTVTEALSKLFTVVGFVAIGFLYSGLEWWQGKVATEVAGY